MSPGRVPSARLVVAATLLAAATALGGCAAFDRNIAMAEAVVVPYTVGDASPVSAHTLADAMLRSGFSHEQILEHGPAVRTALATGGGAQVRFGNIVQALFAIHGEKLYVVSRTTGTFVTPLGEYSEKSF